MGENYEWSNGTLDLNGHALIVNGNFTLSRGAAVNANDGVILVQGNVMQQGTLTMNKSRMNIGGNYSIGSYGKLTMKNEEDYIHIKGNYSASSYSEAEYFSAGTMEIKGNLENYAYYKMPGRSTGRYYREAESRR